MYTTVVIPESVYIGYVIGYGGRTICSIEDSTNTQITWPYKANPADRKFTIYGYGRHAATDVDKAVEEILHLVNGRLGSMELPLLQKRQLKQKRYISDDDFVEILRWLRRFDLDGVQITSKKLRMLIEDNQMPRRHLFEVYFSGRNSNSVMIIPNRRPGERRPFFIDVDRAMGYLSYAFVEKFETYCYPMDDEGPTGLPPRELLTAPDERIKEIFISGYRANFRQAGVLEEAICVCRFEQFSLDAHYIPDWQFSDDFLRRLGRVGCAKVHVSERHALSPNGNLAVTDDGILDYCFSLDLGALGYRERSLWIELGVSIGPAFVKKCIEAHFESHVTARMKLQAHNGDPGPNHVSGFLEHLAEYAVYRQDVAENEIRYDISDPDNSMRLLITIQTADPGAFPVSPLQVRRAHKDDEEFFLRGYAF